MLFLLSLLFIGAAVNCQQDLEQQYNRLPVYTQLDDYDKCLSSENGLYCFGSFRIHPNTNDQEAYNFIKEYSDQSLHFDRKLFHRGYCVSSRCPPHSNATKRFENCVQRSERNLNTSLETLQYCRTQKKSAVLDKSSQAFIVMVLVIIMVNIIASTIDAKTTDGSKSRLITSWSIKSNWKQLVGPFGYDPDMTSLAPIQAMRVVLMSVIIILHVTITKLESYLDDPLWFEQKLQTLWVILCLKGASVVQIFYVLSSFLTSYNLLLLSKKQTIGLWMLPKQFLKRFFRIAPVHLLCVGFAATIWPHIFDGPKWSPKIDTESAICRRKVWYHFFHINNLVEPSQYCLPQTWSLAADMQFQLISLVLTLLLAQLNVPKLKILLGIFFSSCALNVGLGYANGWKPFIHMVKEMDLEKSIHQDISYVSEYYMTPWGSLPSCIMGLIMGHIHFQLRQEGFKFYEHKWLRLMCRYSLPLLALWMSVGIFVKDVTSPIVLSLHLGLERPVFAIIPCIWLFGMINGVRVFPGFKTLSRWIWMPLGRLSLSVLTVHWAIISTRIFSESQPSTISMQILISECIIIWFLSYSLALPITLLVEMPVQNTFTYISSLNFKIHKRYLDTAKRILIKKQE